MTRSAILGGNRPRRYLRMRLRFRDVELLTLFKVCIAGLRDFEKLSPYVLAPVILYLN